MEKCTIKSVQGLTSKAGKPYKTGQLQREDGTEVSFLAYPKFTGYANISEGSEIECILKATNDGDKFFVNDGNLGPMPSHMRKPSGAVEAAKITEKSVKTAQESKEEGIKISSTMGGAVNCAVAEFNKEGNVTSLEELIKKWRKFLWFEWDKHTEYPPFE